MCLCLSVPCCLFVSVFRGKSWGRQNDCSLGLDGGRCLFQGIPRRVPNFDNSIVVESPFFSLPLSVKNPRDCKKSWESLTLVSRECSTGRRQNAELNRQTWS